LGEKLPFAYNKKMLCKSCINLYVLGVFCFKAKEQNKTESSGFVFNKKPYYFSSSFLKLCI